MPVHNKLCTNGEPESIVVILLIWSDVIHKLLVSYIIQGAYMY